jgi:glycerol-3-phosphate dehydrogenase (NAD(P)+)
MRMSSSNAVVVFGAGSWGTALAMQAARVAQKHNRAVVLHGRDSAAMQLMAKQRENARYLPGIAFPEALQVAVSFEEAVNAIADDTLALVSVPSHAFRHTLQALRDAKSGQLPGGVAWATKGLELSTGQMTHDVAAQVFAGCDVPMGVLSGPSFALEVARNLPTSITAASEDESFTAFMAQLFSSDHFRVYTASDIVGVEIGGAVKNVIAIAAGFSDGAGFGANARVALITRGLREMSRLGRALGARDDTFQGLACMGDLVLTCTDDKSRNRRFGLAIATGKTPEQATEEIGQVVEGVTAARAVHEKAQALGIDMPITHAVYDVVHGGVAPEEVMQRLMARTPGDENS